MAEVEPQITQPPVEPPKPSVSEDRIKQLSDKVETASKERDTEKASREAAERERDFYKGYSEVVSTHPAAKDHQDEIKAKVLTGYTIQDATFAVLGAAGKLGGTTPAPQPQVAGGSAATTVQQPTDKSPKEMTQAERRAQLEKDLIWQ